MCEARVFPKSGPIHPSLQNSETSRTSKVSAAFANTGDLVVAAAPGPMRLLATILRRNHIACINRLPGAAQGQHARCEQRAKMTN